MTAARKQQVTGRKITKGSSSEEETPGHVLGIWVVLQPVDLSVKFKT